MTHNGESPVDYVLTEEGNFKDIVSFNVTDFNTFSNHAPISFSFGINTELSSTSSKKHTYYQWNNKYRDAFVNDVRHGISDLEISLLNDVSNGEVPDILVNKFTHFLHFNLNDAQKVKMCILLVQT
jgi:hypothetical protein